jgi:hypothetical protein
MLGRQAHPGLDERRQSVTGRGQDWLKLLSSVTPAGQLVDRMGVLRELLHEVEKRMTRVDELERRVEELEHRVDELSKPARRARRASGARKRPSKASRSEAKD